MIQMLCALFLVLVASLSFQTWTLVLTLWDPFYYRSVIAVTPQVKRGGKFIEELDVERYRICKVEIDRFLISDVSHEVIYRERVPGGATAIGRSKAVRNVVAVPIDAPLGPVTLLQNTNSHCIDGMHSMHNGPSCSLKSWSS